jgi:apolipoprotein N-acyltransferase
MTNLSFYLPVSELLKKKKIRFHSSLLIAIILLLGGCVYGRMKSMQIREAMETSGQSVQLAAIQGNIGDFDKLAAENDVASAALKVIDTLTAMTGQALALSPRPDAIIWPETSFPSLFRQPFTRLETSINERLESFVRDHGSPLLFGGYDRQQNHEFNSFFFLHSDGQLQTYHKNKLLLFGEYIPGAETFQSIKEAFPQVGNFGQGPGAQVLELRVPAKGQIVRIAPIICYEALFPNFLIDSARLGSQMILNITNDSWFGTWGEPQLHLALTTFRSIETRLPQLRSTNTGISTLITANGEITHPTQIGQPEILNVRVPLTPPIWTLMKAWGDWFGPFALVLGLVGLDLMSRGWGYQALHRLFRP